MATFTLQFNTGCEINGIPLIEEREFNTNNIASAEYCTYYDESLTKQTEILEVTFKWQEELSDSEKATIERCRAKAIEYRGYDDGFVDAIAQAKPNMNSVNLSEILQIMWKHEREYYLILQDIIPWMGGREHRFQITLDSEENKTTAKILKALCEDKLKR